MLPAPTQPIIPVRVLWNRLTKPLAAKLMLPVVRVGGATFAGLAFGGLLIGAFGGGAEWLAAAGGLGAVALGAQQVAASIRETEAKRRKVVSLARLIRRSLVEACHLEEGSTSLATWLGQIGNARSLDTLQLSSVSSKVSLRSLATATPTLRIALSRSSCARPML